MTTTNKGHGLSFDSSSTNVNIVVKESKTFIFRLAIISNNRNIKYIEDATGIKPWRTLRFRKTR